MFSKLPPFVRQMISLTFFAIRAFLRLLKKLKHRFAYCKIPSIPLFPFVLLCSFHPFLFSHCSSSVLQQHIPIPKLVNLWYSDVQQATAIRPSDDFTYIFCNSCLFAPTKQVKAPLCLLQNFMPAFRQLANFHMARHIDNKTEMNS